MIFIFASHEQCTVNCIPEAQGLQREGTEGIFETARRSSEQCDSRQLCDKECGGVNVPVGECTRDAYRRLLLILFYIAFRFV